jgi:hypothetical protein
MSTNSRTDHFFIYPKDKNGKYLGVTICVVLRDGRMYHGEAICSKNDQFNKSVGRELSFERAIFEYNRDSDYLNSEELDRCPGCYPEDLEVKYGNQEFANPSDDTDTEEDCSSTETDYYTTEDDSTSKTLEKKETWMMSYDKSSDKQLYQVEQSKVKLPYTSYVSTMIEVSPHPADGGWSAKAQGKVMHSLMDDGNGVDLTLFEKKQRLSYSDFEDIANMYKLWRKLQKQSVKFKKVK